ncbi:peptidase C1 [bacterium]|nr:MAG: peptidase C1 [bacterium]
MTNIERVYDTTKDSLDLRDLRYEGSLVELPYWVDNRGKVPLILNQGREGACTGFSLAAVVNYLKHNRAGALQLIEKESASPRMLYEMAKRYDEWEGEDYEGSSIRAAMKGWNKHGVCRHSVWPYRNETNPRFTTKRQIDALEMPLGNYFRVRHNHLNQIHSAIVEAGILCASANIHAGWDEPNNDTGRIAFSSEPRGGHAFAIVGYDREGLWIQNSWGRDWGLNGFAHITYDDWFENSYDCWVARTGVPTHSVICETGEATMSRAQGFDYLPHDAVVSATIRPHVVNLGNDGRLSESGRFRTDRRDIQDIFSPTGGNGLSTSFPNEASSWSGTPKLMLYAHGGLNKEHKSAARIASMRPYFLANEIYPLHFMWETGIFESLRSMLQDVFNRPRFGGIWDSVKSRLEDLKDEAIELAIRGIGKPVWGEMQENAERASLDRHGADLVSNEIANYKINGGSLELHLVGHSAGAILLAHLIPILDQWGVKVKTLTLYAPACSTELFKENVLPYFGAGKCVDRITIFNLSDEAELDDNVIKVYNKSLLYLVSEALDVGRKQQLLGIQKQLIDDREIKSAMGRPDIETRNTTITTRRGASIQLASNSTSHGGFDNDVDTLNSTLRIIRGSNVLAKPFPMKPAR